MRRLLVGMLAALSLTACSGKTPGADPTAEADSTGGKPQIALTTTCYGECAYTAPLGLPDIAIYGDGRVLVVDRTGTDSRPVLRTGRLDQPTLAGLQRQAIAAGLAVGGSSTLGLTQGGAADGGGTVLTVRLRSNLTTLEVPYLDVEEPGSDRYADAKQHAALVTFTQAVREAAEAADDEQTAAAYVIQARPKVGRSGGSPWPGPPLAALPQIDTGLRCGIITGPDQAAVATAVDADGFGGSYLDGGRGWQVVGRPLLPHEQNCADVRETAAAATASGPRFPGDKRT